jgi:hypothetical protein
MHVQPFVPFLDVFMAPVASMVRMVASAETDFGAADIALPADDPAGVMDMDGDIEACPIADESCLDVAVCEHPASSMAGNAMQMSEIFIGLPPDRRGPEHL